LATYEDLEINLEPDGPRCLATDLRYLLSLETGFNRGSVLIGDIDLRRTHIAKEGRQHFYSPLLGKVRDLPARRVGRALLCHADLWEHLAVRCSVEDGAAWKPLHTYYNGVSPAFFSTFGTRILAGRGFTPGDAAGAPAVALVNSTFARDAFGSLDAAIGRRVSVHDPQPRTMEIVGAVQDAKYRDLRAPVPPTLYGVLIRMLAAAKK